MLFLNIKYVFNAIIFYSAYEERRVRAGEARIHRIMLYVRLSKTDYDIRCGEKLEEMIGLRR